MEFPICMEKTRNERRFGSTPRVTAIAGGVGNVFAQSRKVRKEFFNKRSVKISVISPEHFDFAQDKHYLRISVPSPLLPETETADPARDT